MSKYVEKQRTISVNMTIQLYGNEDQMRRSMRKLRSELSLQHYAVASFSWSESDDD